MTVRCGGWGVATVAPPPSVYATTLEWTDCRTAAEIADFIRGVCEGWDKCEEWSECEG